MAFRPSIALWFVALSILAMAVARPVWAEQPEPVETSEPFSIIDRSIAAGRMSVARTEILQLLASTNDPAILAAGATRLARIELLSGTASDALSALNDSIARIAPSAPGAAPALATLYLQLGAIALAKGENSRAQLALLKGLALAEQGGKSNTPEFLQAELALALAEVRAFRLSEAEARLSRMAELCRTSGPEIEAIYNSVLGELNFRQYRYEAALAADEKSLELTQSLYGPDHPETARASTSLAAVYFSIGRYDAAERTLLKAVEIFERDPKFFAAALATALVNLGQTYYITGRYALSVMTLNRSLALTGQAYAEPSQLEAAARLHKGYVELRLGNWADARGELQRAIEIWQMGGTFNERGAAGASVWLARVERRLGEMASAEHQLDLADSVFRKLFGNHAYSLTDVLLERAELAISRGQGVEAVRFAEEATDIRVNQLGPAHSASLDARSILALALARSGDEVRAISEIGPVTEIATSRIALLQAMRPGSAVEEVAALRRLLSRHVAIIHQILLTETDPGRRHRLLEDSLYISQLARSSAAGAAISGWAQRKLMTTPGASARLRGLQETVSELQAAEHRVRDSIAEADRKSSPQTLSADVDALDHLRQRAAEQQRELLSQYPDIAQFVQPVRPRLKDLQDVLRTDEVVLSYLTTEDHVFLWSLTKTSIALKELDADQTTLQQDIVRLRAALNPQEISTLADIRPFNATLAQKLYATLVEPADPPVGATLIVVPDGSLQSLPFAALLTKPTSLGDDFSLYRHAPWLIANHALSILPDLSALYSLRKGSIPSRAARPFFGIGNPLLPGTAIADPARADLGDLLRSLQPLPDSADELSGLAGILNAGQDDVLVEAQATESRLKQIQLSQYRVIAFATHGLMAGDFGRLREPGLVLTPPAVATEDDDGLLGADEVAALELDADWVILSACNTAAADGSIGAEGLSGLARAFFFAGSRSLLVSQWEVLSSAAVITTNGLFDQLAKHPGAKRAEALRQAYLALMSEDQPDYLSHPVFWAPFELVGEGG